MTTDTLTPNALHDLLVLDVAAIQAIPWQPLDGCPGVEHKVLWRLGGFTQALVRYEPGSSTPGRPHLAAHHHLWVQSGSITIAGRRLGAGSYVHVPPGVRHRGSDVGPRGCTVLQMHRPHAPREGEDLVGAGATQVVAGAVLSAR